MNICIYDHIYGLVGKKCHKGDKCKIAAGVVMAKLVVVIQSAARRSQCRQQKIPVLAAVIALFSELNLLIVALLPEPGVLFFSVHPVF